MFSSTEEALIRERPIGIDLLDFYSRARTFWETFKADGLGLYSGDEGASPFHANC
jgi:hypothetical protein